MEKNPDIRAWAHDCLEELWEVEDGLKQLILRGGEPTDAFKEARRRLVVLLHQDEAILAGMRPQTASRDEQGASGGFYDPSFKAKTSAMIKAEDITEGAAPRRKVIKTDGPNGDHWWLEEE